MNTLMTMTTEHLWLMGAVLVAPLLAFLGFYLYLRISAHREAVVVSKKIKTYSRGDGHQEQRFYLYTTQGDYQVPEDFYQSVAREDKVHPQELFSVASKASR